jgi:pyruvate/2-oxoglutarate dehydrogenase complex dihydrolipoamide dehydrogenase (E3) component
MKYDLLAVGAGSAGLAAAVFAARMGARVALVEADRIGGECTWTGCVPSKALIHAARVVHQARTSAWMDAGTVDFGAVMRGVRDTVGRIAESESAARLQAYGIDVVMGRARFLDAGAVEAGGRRLEARRFVICTGAEPVLPPIPGLLESPYLTHRTVFDLDSLPGRLLVLGGGPVGTELAQAFQRLGSRVSVIEQAGRLLPVADPEAVALIEDRFRREGIELLLGAAVERIERHGGEVNAIASGGNRRLSGDALLVAVGSRPRVAGLGLEEVGVALAPQGVRVDESLRTSVPNIYAAGDVAGDVRFTHYAVWQGYAAARNALFPGRTRGLRPPVPWAVFTDPEVAQVGLSEADAGDRGVEVHRWPVERIDRAQTESDVAGFIKLITAGRDRLLGATIVAAGAADLANQVAIALGTNSRLAGLARTIQIYPTRGYGLLQLAASVGMAEAASSRPVRLIRRLTWGR